MSNPRSAIDGAGNLIEGQVGNRTPILPAVSYAGYRCPQRRRRDRQGGLLGNADASGFPVIPVRLRRNKTAAELVRPPSPLPQANIRRYYQEFVDFIGTPPAPDDPVPRYRQAPNVVALVNPQTNIRRYYATFPDVLIPPPDDPVPRYKLTPFVPPPSHPANQIRRYYQSQLIDPPPDEPTPRYRTPPWQPPLPTSANNIRRYYNALPVLIPMTGRTRVTIISTATTQVTLTSNHTFTRLG